MKIKNLILYTLASVCLLSFSSSVIAATPKSYLETTDVEGHAIEMAQELKPYDYFMGYLSYWNDQDLFTWTNNTRKTLNVTFLLTTPYNIPYDIWYTRNLNYMVKWQFDRNDGNLKKGTLYEVKPGETVHVMVADDKTYYNSEKNYVLTIQTTTPH
ncbi:hypothetical protein ACFPYJ_14995 [Paenibacillus solisilvae]|uniref:Uncharacterized protein n=1 Tax=Paenibacillus solisilvae TaxID=2486751 RepID=A0ABW0VY78_9BACL